MHSPAGTGHPAPIGTVAGRPAIAGIHLAAGTSGAHVAVTEPGAPVLLPAPIADGAP